jgi:hypothetical protein
MKERADKIWEQNKDSIELFIKTIIDEKWKTTSTE